MNSESCRADAPSKLKRSVWFTFHDIYDHKPDTRIPKSARVYHLSRSQFEKTLEIICDAGVAVKTASEAMQWNVNDSIVITFDDGWKGAVDYGLPMLRRLGLKATFFLTGGFMNKEFFFDEESMLLIRDAGMEIGVHGTTHRMLPSLPTREVEWEVSFCRRLIEEKTGLSVDTVSLPGGGTNRRIIEAIRKSGFKMLCSSRPGINREWTSQYALRRVTMRDGMTGSDVERFCRFETGSLLLRWAILEVPHRLLGMKNYTRMRRWINKEDSSQPLFRP